MKKIFLFLIFNLFVWEANACFITFNVLDEKQVYHLNDVVMVKIILELDHRNCDVKPSETLFKTQNVKVIAAGDWKKVGSRTYEREFKLQITGSSGEGTLAVKRECHRDGASGSVSFKIS